MTPSWAFRKAQKVVWFIPIRFRLQILVAKTRLCHLNPNTLSVSDRPEPPLIVLHARDRRVECELPCLAVDDSSDVGDPLVNVVARILDSNIS